MSDRSAMSIAAQLIAEGREEGLWIGKIELLQQLMGQTPTPRSELETWSLEQLKARFANLEQEYTARSK